MSIYGRWKRFCCLLLCLFILSLSATVVADSKTDKILLSPYKSIAPIHPLKQKQIIKKKTTPAPVTGRIPIRKPPPVLLTQPAPLVRPVTRSPSGVPVRRMPLIAPSVLNPRSNTPELLPQGGHSAVGKGSGGFVPTVPSSRPSASIPDRSFGLSPLIRPDNHIGATPPSSGGFVPKQSAPSDGKVPDSYADAPAPPAPSSGKVPLYPSVRSAEHVPASPKPVGGGVQYSNGDIVRDENNGSKTTRHLDGSTETFDRNGGTLNTRSGVKASPAADGGTDVYDSKTGTRGHFGGGRVEEEQGDPKEIGSGRVQLQDGSIVTNESNGSTTYETPDGTTYTMQSDGNGLITNSGVKTSPSADGGTDVYDSETGTRGHFGGGRVEEEQGAAKEIGSGRVQLQDGSIVTNEINGSTTYETPDGTTYTMQSDGNGLVTNPGIKTSPGVGGGTDVYDPQTGVSAHFGGGESTREAGQAKYIGGGMVQEPDGRKHKGEKPENTGSDTSDDRTSSDGGASSSDDNSDSDSSTSSNDDNSSDDKSDSDSDDTSDSNSDDSTSKDDDTSDDNGDDGSASDEARAGFVDGSDGSPEPAAKSTVDDRVARMKGEKRDPESADDSEPGNGGSAPDSVSQPSFGGGHRGSPLAQPSADGHQSPIGNIVTPTVKSRSSVGGGDCFKGDDCGDIPTGGSQLDPLNRDPVTNPGG